MCNNYGFSIAKIVTRKRLIVAFVRSLPLVLFLYLLRLTILMFSVPGQISFYSTLHGDAIGVCTLHVSAWLQHFDAVHSGNLLDLLLVNFSHVSLYRL